MTSQLNVDTIVDKAGSGGTNVKVANNAVAVAEGGSATTNVVQGLEKAWASFEQSGTHTTRSSLNVSSISDLAVGRSSFVFTNNMADANYATPGMSGEQAGGGNRVMGFCGSALTPASNTFAISNHELTNGTASDDDRLSICVLGDLA
jgi:hypothetical protein